MNEYITRGCIIEEYLSNWFTYEELAQYLCVSLETVQKTLDSVQELNPSLSKKIQKHTEYIQRYYRELGNEPQISISDQIYVDIAEYIIRQHASLAKTAKEFGLGKTTIFDYVHQKLPDISITLYKQVFEVLNDNKSFSTNNKRVIDQVLTSYNLLMEGKTGVEIAGIQGIGRNVVQRNLTGRLRNIDFQKYATAHVILLEHRNESIQDYRFRKHGK